MNKFLTTGIGLIATTLLIALPLSGQPTSTSTSTSTSGGEVVELSPFTVDAGADQGYRANNTLSGTRLKTSLSDVGASVSVMTKELLQDLGATNISDAFLYSTNTENENEYAPNDTEGISITTTNGNRVRGIASSNYSRGFFDTNVRGDSYNTERFTLSYGPNAILYGLGSPAGIVDSTTKVAQLRKNSGEVSYRTDTESSHRVTFDYNHVLKNDVLGVRIAALNQDLKSWKQPDSDKESRFYGTLTFKPFAASTLRYTHESMKTQRHKGRSNLPYQAVQTWFDNGRPLWDHINNKLTYDNGATWVNPPLLANGTPDANALYALGIDYRIGTNRRVQANGAIEPATGAWSVIADPAQRALFEKHGIQALRWFQTASSTGRTSAQLPQSSLSDGSLLPLDYNISGLAAFADFDSETNSIVWEQKVAKGLYLELAYNSETWDRVSFDPLRSTGEELQADVNYFLPTIVFPNAASGSIIEPVAANATLVTDSTGKPALIKNPNAGRFYVDGEGIGFNQTFDFETFRATASYELDLTQRNEWFGRHAIAMLYQRDNKSERYMKTRHFSDNDGVVVGLRAAENNIVNRYYIDPPGIGTGGTSGPAYPGTFSESSGKWNTVVWGQGTDGSATQNLRELEGTMVVLQNRLLKERLITTIGLRRDSETVFQSFNDVDSPDPRRPYSPLPDEQAFPTTTGNTRTLGAVFKATKWLSLFYNQSDSFLPQSHLHDYYNQPLKPADGEGKDIGVMVDLMEGKLFARASWFEQSATGALEIDWTYERMKWRLVNTVETAIERWSAVLPSRPNWATQRGLSVDDVFRPAINDNLRSIRDFTSTGIEIELAARPVNGLDLRITFAKNEAVNDRTLPNLQKYVADRLPVWQKYELLAIRPDLTSRVPNPADPSRDTNYGTTRGQLLGNTNVIGNILHVGVEGLNRLAFAKEEEGTVSARSRKYRANFIASYNFSEGRLKGVGIGTGIRYRSKAAIGYLGKANPAMIALLAEEPDLASKVDPLTFLVADISKPLYDKEQIDIDAWVKYQRRLTIAGKDLRWRIQVNIQNLFDDRDLIPLNAEPDGRVRQWAARAPRTVSLTNTLSF